MIHISVLISIRDSLSELYDTISILMGIRDSLFTEGEQGLYDTYIGLDEYPR